MVYLASGNQLQHSLRHNVRGRVPDAVQVAVLISTLLFLTHMVLLQNKKLSPHWGESITHAVPPRLTGKAGYLCDL